MKNHDRSGKKIDQMEGELTANRKKMVEYMKELGFGHE